MEEPEEAAETRARTKVTFPFAVDPTGRLVDHLGLRDPGGNPIGKRDAARSAAIIVRPDGTVSEIILTENYRVRTLPATILEAAAQS